MKTSAATVTVTATPAVVGPSTTSTHPVLLTLPTNRQLTDNCQMNSVRKLSGIPHQLSDFSAQIVQQSPQQHLQLWQHPGSQVCIRTSPPPLEVSSISKKFTMEASGSCSLLVVPKQFHYSFTFDALTHSNALPDFTTLLSHSHTLFPLSFVVLTPCYVPGHEYQIMFLFHVP